MRKPKHNTYLMENLPASETQKKYHTTRYFNLFKLPLNRCQYLDNSSTKLFYWKRWQYWLKIKSSLTFRPKPEKAAATRRRQPSCGAGIASRRTLIGWMTSARHDSPPLPPHYQHHSPPPLRISTVLRR